MSVIVAGGAGFIGVNFVKNIFKYDQEIYIIDNFYKYLERANVRVSNYEKFKTIYTLLG